MFFADLTGRQISQSDNNFVPALVDADRSHSEADGNVAQASPQALLHVAAKYGVGISGPLDQSDAARAVPGGVNLPRAHRFRGARVDAFVHAQPAGGVPALLIEADEVAAGPPVRRLLHDGRLPARLTQPDRGGHARDSRSNDQHAPHTYSQFCDATS